MKSDLREVLPPLTTIFVFVIAGLGCCLAALTQPATPEVQLVETPNPPSVPDEAPLPLFPGTQ